MRRTARSRARAVRALAMQLARPRCVVCDGPIHWGRSGVRLDSVTCGTPSCARDAYRWFREVRSR